MKTKFKHLSSAIILTAFIALAFGSGDDKKSSSKSSDSTSSSSAEETSNEVEILSTSSSYEPVTNSYTIHCRVKNNTDDLVTYVDLKATFYNKDGKIVGTGLGNAANLAQGAEKTIDVMGLDIDNVDHYEVQVNNVM